jgi:branched-chain amino acid transport system substrate-binding protein
VSRRRGWRSRGRRSALAGLGALAAVVGVTACGAASQPPGNVVHGRTLTIWTSLPVDGYSDTDAQAVLDGERLALAQAGSRVGRYRVGLALLDDVNPNLGRWDPGQTSLNAHLAANDPSTIAYLGDYDSGASAVAIPILNRAGIPQLSPTSTAVGLTSSGPGASPGEPEKYYPTGRRTFIALAPSDAAQAAVEMALQRSIGCRHTYVLYEDGDFDGSDAAASFQQLALARHTQLAGVQGFDPKASDYTSLAEALAQTPIDCVFISALPGPHTTLLTTEVAQALPSARLLVPHLLAQPTFTDAGRGGIPARLDGRVLLTVPAAATGALGRAFARMFTTRYGPLAPGAVYGYEAMQIVLAAIRRASGGGRRTIRRSGVLAELLHTRVERSVLGAVSIRPDGSSTLDRYSVEWISDGRLIPWYTAAGSRR